MPLLTHLNNDMNRINRRVVKAMMRQAQDQMPDVPAPPIDSDVTQNYLALMKSLTSILMYLREIYSYRFGIQPEGEVDDYDMPDLPEGFGEEGSQFSGSQQASEISYANPFGSQASVASSGQPFFRRGVASPPSSVYSGPVSRPQSVSQQASTVGRPSTRWEGLSQLSEPRRNEQSIEENIIYAQGNSIVLNSLTREVVNSQFLVEELPFEQLSKIQKQKLKVIIVKIDKVKSVISVGISRPIFIKLNKILSRIATSLGSEGSTSEFLPRTEGEIAPVEGDELIGYGRKHRNKMLSPAMFASHNVNSMFVHSLSKRNN